MQTFDVVLEQSEAAEVGRREWVHGVDAAVAREGCGCGSQESFWSDTTVVGRRIWSHAAVDEVSPKRRIGYL